MQARKRDRELDEAIRELARADTLAFGGVGFAGQTLAPTAAYQALERMLPARAEDLRGRLTGLLTDATPAGKAYAASLLDRFDPAAGRAAWESLSGDDGALTTFTGCVMGRSTLGEYARDRLRPDDR
ncbi:hypothetical protein [Plantactinospora sp. KBS50]|uniref:hypothetical protein n=1 Tax=Plantactinospora sp. KBS50 TaxID=2024580 RepID=UPI000BAB1FBD|nr:hypothetical protein [Plantactinospora sp. KBS50]ASW53027.1 hypothetical protein CIK06_00725 [Plantactinospora sp. KBS50]